MSIRPISDEHLNATRAVMLAALAKGQDLNTITAARLILPILARLDVAEEDGRRLRMELVGVVRGGALLKADRDQARADLAGEKRIHSATADALSAAVLGLKSIEALPNDSAHDVVDAVARARMTLAILETD